MVGLHWQGSGTPWYPDAQRRRPLERVAARRRRLGPRSASGGGATPTGPEARTRFRFATPGRVTRLREYLLWSPPVDVPVRRAAARGLAGDHLARRLAGRRGDPPRAAAVRADAAARGRPPHRQHEQLHVRAVGVDRARHRGLPRQGKRLERHRLQRARRQVRAGVRGPVRRDRQERRSARTRCGFNTGSFGVALIGTYSSTAPTTVERQALVKLLAWRLDVAHIDPLSTVVYKSGGNSKFAAGTAVTLRAVSGHRDTYLTECPGNRALQAAARDRAAGCADRRPEALCPRGRRGARRPRSLHRRSCRRRCRGRSRSATRRRRSSPRVRAPAPRSTGPGTHAPSTPGAYTWVDVGRDDASGPRPATLGCEGRRRADGHEGDRVAAAHRRHGRDRRRRCRTRSALRRTSPPSCSTRPAPL